MKKRMLKKSNQKKINKILKQIPFTITKKVFGNGYFILTFPSNSICWFWLKEFPLYKFAVWLGKDDSYDIFGEAMVMIDKFKPSASTISENNVESFINELFLIQNQDKSYKKYFRKIKHSIATENRAKLYNSNVLKSLDIFIKKFNEENKGVFSLAFKPFNKYNRPTIELFTIDDTIATYIDVINIYEQLCNNIYYNKRFYSDFYNTFYSFNATNSEILNPLDYEYRSNRYNWKKSKSFKQMIRLMKVKEALYILKNKKGKEC